MSTAYRLRLKIVSNTGKKRVGLGPYVYWKSGRPASVSEKSSQGSDHSRSPGGKGAGSLNRIDPGSRKYLGDVVYTSFPTSRFIWSKPHE